MKKLSCVLAILLALTTMCVWAAEPGKAGPKGKPGPKGKAAKAEQKTADGWVELFDGKSLRGWMILSGYATYEAKDGMIVGTTSEGSGNTFLCTTKSYGDFILEFETMNDPQLNSGVQFRSHVYPAETAIEVDRNGKKVTARHPAGRVYGYQAEISNEATGTSGGIYDEARRACWLFDASKSPTASKAFKDNQWNKYRIECRGNSIKTFVNGVPCADFTDDADASGLIGLQVHGIKGAEAWHARWRNIRIQELPPSKP